MLCQGRQETIETGQVRESVFDPKLPLVEGSKRS